MIAETPPPIVTPSIAVRAGVSDPRGTIVRLQSDTIYSDQRMGLGATTELQVGARFYSMISVVAFGQLAWFSCGYTYACDGSSRLLGGMVRVEPPSGRARPFFEIGLGWRRIDVGMGGGAGTSASITYEMRSPAQQLPHAVLTGTDLRFAVGGALRLASSLELELATDVSLGRYSSWKDRRRGNLDPNVPLAGDEIADDEQGLHGFIGISLGARWLPR